MKTWAVRIAAGAGLFLAGGFTYLGAFKPAHRPAADIRVLTTPDRIARGKYIFENLADCAGCHSERDFSKFGGPVLPGRLGAGMDFAALAGLPGKVVAPNITPDPETGLGNWTDGEIIRAIREGVGRDGRALFPMMPYGFYSKMSDEDAYSLVAYLRSMQAVKAPRPRTALQFPVNVLIRMAPQPVETVKEPDCTNPVKYGEYLATLGGCIECHTPTESNGKPMSGKHLAGGREFQFGKFVFNTANITPDLDTGIGSWSEERFVRKFVNYREMAKSDNSPVMNQANATLMPWLNLAQLKDEDLKAIYAYLRTVPAVYNPVDMHPAQAIPTN